jgi:hypothetical protein
MAMESGKEDQVTQINTKGNTLMIKNKDMASTHGQTETFTKEIT